MPYMSIPFTILLSMTMTVTFCQQMDTVQLDIGKPGRFSRIRELTTKGQIRKVWSTFWTEDGHQKLFSQYNSSNRKVTSLDSMFNNSDILVGIERKLSNTIEGDKQEFDDSGHLISRDLSLYINGKYLVFQKYMDNGAWIYRTIVDRNPPDYIPINKERFEEGVNIYNDRLLVEKIIK